MESTGVYWIPLFELLAERGFDVKLVDPGQLKNVPGRKTDVLDCQWIQQLLDGQRDPRHLAQFRTGAASTMKPPLPGPSRAPGAPTTSSSCGRR